MLLRGIVTNAGKANVTQKNKTLNRGFLNLLSTQLRINAFDNNQFTDDLAVRTVKFFFFFAEKYQYA